MRKSFDGLSGIITNEWLGDPTSGDVYIFINRRRDRMKLLIWDRIVCWLWVEKIIYLLVRTMGLVGRQSSILWSPLLKNMKLSRLPISRM